MTKTKTKTKGVTFEARVFRYGASDRFLLEVILPADLDKRDTLIEYLEKNPVVKLAREDVRHPSKKKIKSANL